GSQRLSWASSVPIAVDARFRPWTCSAVRRRANPRAFGGMNMTSEKKLPRPVFAITPERKDMSGNIVKKEGEGKWREVGAAWVNADNSINIVLDAMPVNGRLQIRDRIEPKQESLGGAA